MNTQPPANSSLFRRLLDAAGWPVLLVIFIPIAVILQYGGAGSTAIFITAALGVIPTAALMGRAITDPSLQTAAYLAIIVAEITGAALLWSGFVLLWRARTDDALGFHEAKGLALFALMWCFAIWTVGFIAIGGEWFAMWQSATWNGQSGATRFATVTGIVMLFLAIRE